MSDVVKKVFSAVNYIKDSNFAVGEKHDWVRHAIEQILNTGEPFTTSQIKKIVLPDTEQVDEAIEKSLSYAIGQRSAKTITSISKVYNIGLLDIETPVTFSTGLNVIYGHNGAGKSSLYAAIAQTSGKNIPIFSDLNNDIRAMGAEVAYIDSSDTAFSVAYDTDKRLMGEDLNIQFFDTNIAQKLVSTDQENRFDLSHLQQEYFAYVYDLLEALDIELRAVHESTRARGVEVRDTLATQIENFADYSIEELLSKKALEFTEEDKAEKSRLGVEIKKLNKETLNLRKQQLTGLKVRLERFLNYFEVDKEESLVSSSFDEGFFNDCLVTNTQYKKTLGEFNEIKNGSLGQFVPDDWQKNDQWIAFIKSGINFTNQLLKAELHEHSPDERCIYCHQTLATDASKELLAAYKSIFTKYNTLVDEHGSELNKKKAKLFNAIKQIEDFTQDLNSYYQLTDCVLSRPTGGYAEIILQNFYDGLDNEEDLYPVLTAHDFKQFISSLYDVFDKTALELQAVEDSLKEVDKTLQSLERQQGELLLKEKFSLNAQLIAEYLELKSFFEMLKEKQSSVSALKQHRSKIQSAFSEEAGMNEFRQNLVDEYDYFSFKPPRGFDISTKTTGLTNSRVFSLRDNKLADIFSEGEIKIHALADFFAQNKLNRYIGVYVFDDPVNSLDQLNIEIVAERLLDLVADGNQVFVFTHNIFFANELEDLSKDRGSDVNFISVKKKMVGEGVLREGVVEVNKLGKFDDDKGIRSALKDLQASVALLPVDDNAEVSQQLIKDTYDYISCYLEYYLEQVLFKNIIGRHRAHIRMGNLQSVTVDDEVKTKITTIYRRTSRKGTRHSQPPEVSLGTLKQLKEDATYILENLKP